MKILGSDYDGTLNHGGITEEKLDAIQKWRQVGNKFGIISGRGPDFYDYLKSRHPELQFDFMVTCNGGCILDHNGQILFGSPIIGVSISELATKLFSLNCSCVYVRCEKNFCVINDTNHASNTGLPEYSLDNIPEVSQLYQLSVKTQEEKQAIDLVKYLRFSYPQCLNPLKNGLFIDIVDYSVNKAQGFYKVMKYYGAKYEDIIAVGDNINDIDMIKEFHSYAMENGVASVKELADDIVSDVKDVIAKELEVTVHVNKQA